MDYKTTLNYLKDLKKNIVELVLPAVIENELKLSEKRLRLYYLWSDGKVDKETYQNKTTDLDNEIKRLKERENKKYKLLDAIEIVITSIEEVL